ncbi:MAG TPA: hypothetical protein PLU43_06390 [Lachnospiraceae bacterium]|nr:hypothetical protein [Lachnospiraceae bacterium]
MKAIVIVSSCHHHNTEKVGQSIASVLNAPIITPQQISPQELTGYDLIGFGSGIYGGMHHRNILDLTDTLLRTDGAKAFIFSADRGPRFLVENESFLQNKTQKDHKRDIKLLGNSTAPDSIPTVFRSFSAE